jgi:hypothetical protein
MPSLGSAKRPANSAGFHGAQGRSEASFMRIGLCFDYRYLLLVHSSAMYLKTAERVVDLI